MVIHARTAGRVAHHVADGVRRGERPEGVVRGELPGREVEAVNMFATEPRPCTVNGGCPVGGFFKHVDDRKSLLQHCRRLFRSSTCLKKPPTGQPPLTVQGRGSVANMFTASTSRPGSSPRTTPSGRS